MSFHCRGKRRGLHGALILCVLIVAALGLATQSASASNIACPSGEAPAGGIERWVTDFPTGTENGHGVTLCQGVLFGERVQGYLQIVDLRAGARIRLRSIVSSAYIEEGPEEEEWRGVEERCGCYGEDVPFTKYEKETTRGWYRIIEEEEFFHHRWWFEEPAPRLLFSTTNAAFFTSAEEEGDTAVPFPLVTNGGQSSMGLSYARGERGRDSDYEAPKRVLQFGYGLEAEEQEHVGVSPFPARYEDFEVQHLNEWYSEEQSTRYRFMDEALVSFTPEYRVGELARRNYLGVYNDEAVYIFTSNAAYTNAEVVEIMQEIHSGMRLIQLDGGGSASIYSRFASMGTLAEPISERTVPNVLAVYLSER